MGPADSVLSGGENTERVWSLSTRRRPVSQNTNRNLPERVTSSTANGAIQNKANTRGVLVDIAVMYLVFLILGQGWIPFREFIFGGVINTGRCPVLKDWTLSGFESKHDLWDHFWLCDEIRELCNSLSFLDAKTSTINQSFFSQAEVDHRMKNPERVSSHSTGNRPVSQKQEVKFTLKGFHPLAQGTALCQKTQPQSYPERVSSVGAGHRPVF